MLFCAHRFGGKLDLVVLCVGGEGGVAQIQSAYLVLDRSAVAHVSKISERAAVTVEQGAKVCGCHGTTLVLEDIALDATLKSESHPPKGNRLWVVFDQRSGEKLLRYGLHEGEFTLPVKVKFFHNHSKFDYLRQSTDSLTAELIARILLPEEKDLIQLCARQLTPELDPYVGQCSQDQRDALQTILSLPPNSPPLLVRGAFGTGKTFLLAAAVHCLFRKETGGGGRGAVRVLVCTPCHASSQRFVEVVHALGHLPGVSRVVQLVSGSAEVGSSRDAVTALQLKRDLESVVGHPSLLVVTTYLSSSHLTHLLHRGFFSFILLDDGSQVMEPEGVVPLTLVGPSTKVVMTGDLAQVRWVWLVPLIVAK